MVADVQLEIEGNSLEEVRCIAQKKVPVGFKIVSEQIIDAGGEKTAQGTGNTIEVAFKSAENAVPPHTDIRERRTIRTPDRAIEVTASSERAAWTIAKKKADSDESVAKIRLKVAGRRGFIFVGRTPSIFEVVFNRPAIVEILFRIKTRVKFALGRLPSKPELLMSLGKLGVTVETVRTRYPAARAEFGATALAAMVKILDSVVPQFNSLLNDAKMIFPEDSTIQAFMQFESKDYGVYLIDNVSDVLSRLIDKTKRDAEVREFIKRNNIELSED